MAGSLFGYDFEAAGAAEVFRPRTFGGVAGPEAVEAVADAVREAMLAHYDPAREAARWADPGRWAAADPRMGHGQVHDPAEHG